MSTEQHPSENEFWYPFHPDDISDLATLQLGPLYWKISQTPRELELDFVYLTQLLSQLNINGSIYLHSFQAEKQSSMIGSVSQNGEAVGAKFLLGQKNKKRKVQSGEKLSEICIDHQKVRQEASDNNLDFAQLYQNELIEALIELNNKDLNKIGSPELFLTFYFLFFLLLFTFPEISASKQVQDILFSVFVNWISANFSTFVAEKSSKKIVRMEARMPNYLQIPLKAAYIPNWFEFAEMKSQQHQIHNSSRQLIRFRPKE
jgi:hypothetical protein